MFKQKSKAELQKTEFVIIRDNLEIVAEKVDEMVKTLISNRSSFYIEGIEISLMDELPWVDIKCVYLEQGWDVENQKLTNDYDTFKFEIDFSFEYFDYDDLPNMIYTRIQEKTLNS